MDQSWDIHSMHHASASLNLRYCPVTINDATYVVAIADGEILSLCFVN